MQSEYTRQQSLESEIILAFEKRQFYLVFQPIMHLRNKEIVGCEALIRWRHPIYGEFFPENYVHVIASMGLADKLNLYVVSECLRVFKGLRQLKKPLVVSINISPHTHNLEKNIKHIVELFGKDHFPDQLKFNLEITETSFMEKQVDASKHSIIHYMLSKYGIGLALDDFGVEYSSITRLLDSQFAVIKIDMSFVQKLGARNGKAAQTTIEAIMHLATGLGIKVIAEGIQTKEQVEVLSNLGCYLGQGFYYYKPQKSDQFMKLINHDVVDIYT